MRHVIYSLTGDAEDDNNGTEGRPLGSILLLLYALELILESHSTYISQT
jgi:hypothetical protein